jgi:predicted ester cyclase
MMAYLANDFVRFSTTSETWGPMSKEDWRDMSVRFYLAFPDEKWEVLSMVASGDAVAVEVIESGTFTKPWDMPGIRIQPTGKGYRSRNAAFFQVNKNGLIQNYRLYYESKAFLTVGIKPEDVKSTY